MGRRRSKSRRRKSWPLVVFTVLGLLGVGAGAVYAVSMRNGMVPHKSCNATAVPTSPGTALIFSLQPDVRKDVTIQSVTLSGMTPGMEIVALGYRGPDSADTKYSEDPAQISLTDVRGLKLTHMRQLAFSAIVRAVDAGIYSVTGFDVRYKQGIFERQVHYSDAFAFRAGISPEAVSEIHFVDCERWEMTPPAE